MSVVQWTASRCLRRTRRVKRDRFLARTERSSNQPALERGPVCHAHSLYTAAPFKTKKAAVRSTTSEPAPALYWGTHGQTPTDRPTARSLTPLKTTRTRVVYPGRVTMLY